MPGSMIDHAADFFKSRRTQIEAWYSDDKGRYAFRVTVQGQRFVTCAKKYVNHGRASFMKGKVLERARDQDALVLLFIAEGNRWLVFDPRHALVHGEPSGGKSKRVKKGEDWLDVDTDCACSLEAFIDGHAEPDFDPDGSGDETGAKPSSITDWGDA